MAYCHRYRVLLHCNRISFCEFTLIIVLIFLLTAKFHYNPESVKEINEATFELNEQTDFMVKDKLGPEDKAVRWRVPINSTRNYFECEIISKGEAGSGIWIGLGEYPAYQDEFYFYENIVSFQVENGHIHRGDACRVQLQDCTDYALKLNLTYAEGDRIGCGIDFDFDQCHSNYVDVFFTKNGMQIGDLIRCKKYFFCNTMCPVVGMREVGEKIRFLKHCYQPSLLSVSKAILLYSGPHTTLHLHAWVLCFSD